MAEYEWPVFEQALKTDGLLGALLEPEQRAFLDLAASRYDRTKPDLIDASEAPSIPRIIHQIWLGGDVPADLHELSRTWLSHHPDWDYRLWTDKDVEGFEFENRDLFEKADCWGQKTDILRAEIVNRFGGVYVDFDYICYKPIDEIASRYDFFGTLRNIFPAHLGWPEIWRWPVIACNSFFGSKPAHPILTDYLEKVRKIWQQPELYEFRKGELPWPALAAIGGAKSARRIKETGMRTYLPYHEVVVDHLADDNEQLILFPPVFFNPVMSGAKTLYMMPDFWKRCSGAGIRMPDVRPYNRQMPYSLGKHLSKNSWL